MGFGPRVNIPQFQNLRSLYLLEIDNYPQQHNFVEIAEVLISSPGLRKLGLSADANRSGKQPHGLPPIINYYFALRATLQLPPLKLSHLHLGEGFVPHKGLEASFDGNRDYLSMLTGLTALRVLKLQNYLGTRPYKDGKLSGVDSEIFQKVHHLRCLDVSFFTHDIGKLLEIPDLSKSITKVLQSQ